MKKPLILISLLVSALFSVLACTAALADQSYAYMRFHTNRLDGNDKLKDIRVLKVDFGQQIGYGPNHFEVNSSIKHGTESGFRAAIDVGGEVAVTVGTPDWQNWCQIKVNVTHNRFTDANTFETGSVVVNRNGKGYLGCHAETKGQLMNVNLYPQNPS